MAKQRQLTSGLGPAAFTHKRTTQAPGQGNGGGSRVVGFMRVVLPAMALTLIGLLAAWPALNAPQVDSGLRDLGRNEVINARYLSRNEDNLPFQLVSETAVQMTSDAALVDLAKPSAEFAQDTGGWLTVDAEQGWYNRETGMLDLYRNVHFLRDDGVELFTEVATVDTRKGTVRSDVPVSGIGSSGEIVAEGFRMYDYGKRIVFLNGSEADIAMNRFSGT